MYRRTYALCKDKMISTVAGQRRILKLPMDSMTYIQKAVETGVYRSNEEKEKMLAERRLNKDPIKEVMRRFRQDIVRGASVHDYPDTYMILRQNPLPPAPPKISKRKVRMNEKECRKNGLIPADPMEKLTEKYLHRYQLRPAPGYENPHEYPDGAPSTGEEYYRRVLGVAKPPDPIFSFLGRKAAPIQRAYASALKHYTLVKTEGLSEAEAMKRVDELLQQEKQDEYKQAATVVANAQKEQRKQQKPQTIRELAQQHERDTSQSWRNVLKGGRKDIALEEWKERKIQKEQQHPPPTKLEHVFHNVLGSEPRVLEAMMRWSKRLELIPYQEWTVGASTSLDHWIARQVLGYSEATWQALLEGDQLAYAAHGQKLIETREALFPETALHTDPFLDHHHHQEKDVPALPPLPPIQPSKPTDMSLDELLESLGNLTAQDSSKKISQMGTAGTDQAQDTMAQVDQRMEQLITQLQEWRREHHNVAPYHEWSKDKQDELNHWITREFVPACTSSGERYQKDFDLDETRKAILAPLPQTPEESDAFWSSLHNEQDAAKLLHAMRTDGPPPGASFLQAHFWELDYDTQLEQLLNFGAIRPLLDEYTKESDRTAFIQKYSDVLLTGVPLEYLVQDPEGPIAASDIPMKVLQELGLTKMQQQQHEKTRYRLEQKPYRASHDDDNNNEETAQFTVGRAMFVAWNEFKANRARYEEELFRSQRLGLTYDQPLPKEDNLHDILPELRPPTYDDPQEARQREKYERRRQKKLEKLHSTKNQQNTQGPGGDGTNDY